MIECSLQDLEYIVKNSANKRQKISLLSKVSGSLYPRELTALVRISALLSLALPVPIVIPCMSEHARASVSSAETH